MNKTDSNAAVLDVLAFHIDMREACAKPNLASELRQVRDAVAEYIAANEDLLVLYRLKWGNLDPDANAVYDRAIAAHARMKGETK